MEFGIQHLVALLPILITGLTVVIVMLGIAWKRNHAMTFTLSVIGLNAALISLFFAMQAVPLAVTPLFYIDYFSGFYMGLTLIATLACITLAYAYLEDFPGNREELYLLFLLAAMGSLVLVSTQHLAGLFIGLELLSVPLYGLVAYAFFNKTTLEAGIKYIVLSAVGSAFLLFGIALLYADSGSLNFVDIGAGLVNANVQNSLAQMGIGLMLIGLAFKLSLVPFHLWTADVYQGAPAPVAAFLVSVSKIGVVAVLVRLLELSPVAAGGWLNTLLIVIAIASILIGNLLALTQVNLKRLLAYSSIAQLGYVLVALIAHEDLSIEAIGVFMTTYILSTLGAFGVISLMSAPYQARDADLLSDYHGLFWRRPYLTAVLTMMLLSLAGVPLTAGFIGKFFIISAGAESSLWWLLSVVVIGSAIAVFYYLRVIVALYIQQEEPTTHDAPTDWAQRAGGIVLMGIALTTSLLGIYPQPLISLLHYCGLTIIS